MNIDNLIDFLFRNSNWSPQIGFARMDKRALLWVPGKKELVYEKVSKIVASAPIKGCTQLAFETWKEPVQLDSSCEICWVGLDIDQDDNPGVDLVSFFLDWTQKNPCSMLRTSCSGTGIHLLYVLLEPVKCCSVRANKIVKAITKSIVEDIEKHGIHVCKADRRMFWLTGGKNAIISQSNYVLVPDIITTESVTPVCLPAREPVEASDSIKHWINRFVSAKILPAHPGKSTPIYIGDVVRVLREAGEAVKTASRCSGNGNVNGYIDISPNQISVWSYADGHTIWSYQDIRGLFNGT